MAWHAAGAYVVDCRAKERIGTTGDWKVETDQITFMNELNLDAAHTEAVEN